MQNTRTAIITGAGSGVGKRTAATFLKNGWNTVLVGRRQSALDEAVAAAGDTLGKALAISCDVSKSPEVEAMFDRVVEVFGRVDLLFNNAGTGFKAATPDEIPVEAWENTVAVNLNGSFYCARAAFRVMRAQKPQGGRIINNGSVSAYAPRPGSIPYTATKHAVTGLTKSLALDGRTYDIACGQIDIGNALTEMAHAMTLGVPQANGTIAIEPTIDVQRVADSVLHMANMPLDTNVLFMNVMATKMPFVGRG